VSQIGNSLYLIVVYFLLSIVAALYVLNATIRSFYYVWMSMGVESPVIMGLQFSLPDGREWVR
jgi:hypothetical protein